MATSPHLAVLQKRQRILVTPEGLSLPLTIASRGSRVGALFVDFVILNLTMAIVTGLLIYIGLGVLGLSIDGDFGNLGPLEFLAVLWLILMFAFRYGYFLYFELGPRGATPGKRMLGIRVAARGEGDGNGRLTAEAVIARNLLRDIELFMPLVLIIGAQSGEGGLAGIAAAAWFAIFMGFPFFNRDAMRAGDLIAGTWVVEVPKRRLSQSMSVAESAGGASQAPDADFRFTDADLAVYGEYELKTLERVLRDNQPQALEAVTQAIAAKIGWTSGSGHERAFLEAYYQQLRARLERDMRFGQRKADKHS